MGDAAIATLAHGADRLATGIEFLALAVLAAGVWRAMACWVAERPWARPAGDLAGLRVGLGVQILVALELLICADIMHSVTRRSAEDLVALGAVVLIRTVIAVFLNHELREARAHGDRTLSEKTP